MRSSKTLGADVQIIKLSSIEQVNSKSSPSQTADEDGSLLAEPVFSHALTLLVNKSRLVPIQKAELTLNNIAIMKTRPLIMVTQTNFAYSTRTAVMQTFILA